MPNFKTLASLCSWGGQFESYLVANPEDRFSRHMAHIMLTDFKMIVSSPNNKGGNFWLLANNLLCGFLKYRL